MSSDWTGVVESAFFASSHRDIRMYIYDVYLKIQTKCLNSLYKVIIQLKILTLLSSSLTILQSYNLQSVCLSAYVFSINRVMQIRKTDNDFVNLLDRLRFSSHYSSLVLKINQPSFIQRQKSQDFFQLQQAHQYTRKKFKFLRCQVPTEMDPPQTDKKRLFPL